MSGGNGFGKNVILYAVDHSSSVHASNKKKDILIICKGPTEILDDATATEENEYFINFIEQ